MVDHPALVILLIGILISLSFWSRVVMSHLRMPPVAAYILIGIGLKVSHLLNGSSEILDLLGEIGIIILLFRVGMDCNLSELMKHVRRASLLATSNIFLSGAMGFLSAFYLIGLELIPSLFVGAALTATSIGVAVIAWKDESAMNKEEGKILVDMAVLDDIIAIILMGILLAIAPLLKNGLSDSLWQVMSLNFMFLLFKLALLMAGCFLFSYFLEGKMMGYLRQFEKKTDPMLTAASIGLIIAAVASFFGFSTALGAFFAGIAFSRDPKEEGLELSLKPLEDLFTPFFFIGIGLKTTPELFTSGIGITAILITVAILGKVIGTVTPALLLRMSRASALLLGVSMIPRAEISLIVLEEAANLGTWALPNQIYSSMVLLSLFTCLVTPPVIYKLLRKV